MPMTIHVHLFATLKQQIGADAVPLELHRGVTAGDAVTVLTGKHPELAGLFKKTALAVNCTYIKSDHVLSDGDELALIPPVSGGAPSLDCFQ